MTNNDSLKNVASRLFKEQICIRPLDERSLEIVLSYMNYYSSHNDLCRRMSDIELNYVQISSDAENACENVIESNQAIISVFKNLIDQCRLSGYFSNYFFLASDSDIDNIRSSYTTALEFVRNHLKLLSNSLLTISETAAQIRACSASFGEIYKEVQLAIYAAMLNRDVEMILDCRATSLQSHASIKECEKLSSNLMGNARNCTKIINCVNNTILQVNQQLKIDTFDYDRNAKISPMIANQTISSAILAMENIKIEKYN